MKQPRGQTLIEVLITLFFMAIAVIALVRFQGYLAYNNLLSQQKSDASLLALSQLETLKNFQVINTTSGYTAYQNITNGTSTSTVGNTTYTVSWAVTSYTTPAYKNINVTVTWTDRNGATQTQQLSTHIGAVDPATSATVI